MNEFLLWMNTLDAQEVASKESFHSQNHRDWMALHEMEKVRIASRTSRSQDHERHLTRIAEVWARKDKRAGTIRERVAANPVSNFTQQQLDIAEKALNKKEN